MASKTYVVALQVTDAEGALRLVARGMLAKVRLDVTTVDGAFATQSGLLSVSGQVLKLYKADGATFPVRADLAFEGVQANIVAGTINFRLAKGPIVGTVVASISKDWKTIDALRIDARTNGGDFAQYLSHVVATGRGKLAAEDAGVPQAAKIHATDFLNYGATVRCSFHLLDPRNDSAAKTEAIQYLVRNGYSVAYVCASIQGDRKGAFRLGDNVSVETARKWLQAVKDAGLRTWLWFRSDDSPVQDAWTESGFNDFMKFCAKNLGDLVEGYVLGIECNEWGWGVERIKRHCGMIREYENKPIGVHTGSIEHIAFADNASVYFLQYGFNKATQNIAAKTKQAKARWSGKKRVIACEYNMHGETVDAKQMGEDAVRAGADGFGNGGTEFAMQLLRERGDVQDSHESVTPVETGARIESLRPAAKKYYVQWHATGLDGWPVEENIIGWIVIKGVHIEQFRPGYTQQHLKNAYGKIGKGEHGIDVRNGETVMIKFQSIDGKHSTNEVPFVWPWESRP